jgi:hypothetical protein
MQLAVYAPIVYGRLFTETGALVQLNAAPRFILANAGKGRLVQ